MILILFLLLYVRGNASSVSDKIQCIGHYHEAFMGIDFNEGVIRIDNLRVKGHMLTGFNQFHIK